MNRLKRLISEIHRRSLWQVLLIYIGAAWACFELIATVADTMGLPGWLPGLAIVLFLLGLPFVVATALVREEPAPSVVPSEATEAEAQRVEVEAAAAKREATRRHRFLTWRNAAASFVVALAVWGVVAAGWLLVEARDREAVEAEATISANRIAVFPFSFRGSDEFAYLADGMVDLLSATLDGAGELRSVDPRAVLGVIDQQGGGAPDPERARALAEQFGAGRYVLGDIVEVERQLRVTTYLYGLGETHAEPVRATVGGEPDELYRLVDELTAQLALSVVGASATRLAGIAAMSTDSLAALKLYLEGESKFRTRRVSEAIDAFERAVEIDSAFALAWYKLSRAAEWNWHWSLARQTAERAVHSSDRLPNREREVLAAWWAHVRGAADDSEQLYRAALVRYPDDVEAWSGFGELLYHYNRLRARSWTEAREPCERALSYEPDLVPPLVLLIIIAAAEGNWSAYDSLWARYDPDRRSFPNGALRAFGTGDRLAQQQVLADARRTSLVSLHQSVVASGMILQEPLGALGLAHILAEQADSPEMRGRAHLDAAHLELARGRWRAAQAELDSLASQSVAWANEYRALLSIAPFLPTPPVVLEALRDSLARWEADAVRQSVHPYFFIRALNGVHHHLRQYLLGVLSARLGDHDAALRHAAELEAMEAPPHAGTLAVDLALGIRALVAWERGHPDEVLRALEAAPHEVHFELAWASAFYSQARERYLRARALESLGRYRAALDWYATLEGHSHEDLVYLAPSHLHRARIYEQLGEPDRAAIHYNRFITLWHDADPELQPRVEAARRAIEALSPDT